MKKISVIVPFYNSGNVLHHCLEALLQQTYPACDFEIIAVDNGSSENLSTVKRAFPMVQWLSESQPGSSCARNRGLSVAEGEIIAFTDADCIPSRSWLEEAAKTSQRTGATIIAGRVDYIDPLARKLNAYELIEEKFFLLNRQKFLVEKLGVAATANLVTYRRVFEKIGGFDPQLLSFHDGDWVKRATAAGERLTYAESALVMHPRRDTFQAVLKKARRTAGDKIVLMKKQKWKASAIAWDLFRYSPISPFVHWTALFFPGARGILQRMQLVVAVEILCLVATVERFRVLLGGRGFRG